MDPGQIRTMVMKKGAILTLFSSLPHICTEALKTIFPHHPYCPQMFRSTEKVPASDQGATEQSKTFLAQT